MRHRGAQFLILGYLRSYLLVSFNIKVNLGLTYRGSRPTVIPKEVGGKQHKVINCYEDRSLQQLNKYRGKFGQYLVFMGVVCDKRSDNTRILSSNNTL